MKGTQFNFQVKASPKPASKDQTLENEKLIRKFMRKWKRSGILKELKDKTYPRTKGQKERRKRYLGKRRNNNKKK